MMDEYSEKRVAPSSVLFEAYRMKRSSSNPVGVRSATPIGYIIMDRELCACKNGYVELHIRNRDILLREVGHWHTAGCGDPDQGFPTCTYKDTDAHEQAPHETLAPHTGRPHGHYI